MTKKDKDKHDVKKLLKDIVYVLNKEEEEVWKTGNYDVIFLWCILSALRGSDIHSRIFSPYIKRLTTARIRSIIGLKGLIYETNNEEVTLERVNELLEFIKKSKKQLIISEHFLTHFKYAIYSLFMLNYISKREYEAFSILIKGLREYSNKYVV
jgi:hypothetical protein